jgi:Zn-dependent protease
MSEFYAIDSSRVSLREYWWGAKSPLVFFSWMLKWFRARIPSSSDDPNVDSILPFQVEGLPPEMVVKFEPLSANLAALGFSDPVFHLINDPGTRTTVYWSTFRHVSGQHFARIHHRIWQQAQKSDRGLFPMFITEFTDGTFLVSSAGKPDMAAPKSVNIQRMPGAKPEVLWAAHNRAVQGLTQRNTIRPIHTQADVIEATERHHVLMRDFHLARGVFRKRTATELAQADSFNTRLTEAQAAGLEHPGVMIELERLQEQKPSWRSGLWILGASFIGFIAAGAARWDWKFMLWIIPILLFHESGHWVAMKLFRYRNLRLFFIPFFGAAVTGRNWNVAGWKKALVSLAGPVPGIALGIVLGLIGLVLHQPQVIHGALLLLFVNGFNLLPLLPLDGGHVLQDTLFCRNRWLDVAFRIVAMVGLLLLGLFAGMKLLMYIAIPLGLAIPTVFRLSKVTDDLRTQSLPEPLPSEDRIPAETAQRIITAVRGAFPPKLNMGNKVLAQHTLGVFERLNAKPPGVLATLALLFIHGGALLISLIVGLLLVFAQNRPDLSAAASSQLQSTFQPGDIQSWPAAPVGDPRDVDRNLLVTTLNNRAAAVTAFSGFTNQLPPEARLMRFGDSLLLSVPAENDSQREQWFDRLQAQSTNVFVALSNAPVTVSLSFFAPDKTSATNLEHVLQQYLVHSFGMHLIAPWSPAAKQARFAEFNRCRRDWMRISEVQGRVAIDPSLRVYEKKIIDAAKRGSIAEQERLRKEETTRMELLRTQALQELRSDPVMPVSADLLALSSRLNREDLTNAVERKTLLGRVASQLGAVQCPPMDRFGVRSGFVLRNGLLLQIPSAGFYDPTVALPALTDWLREQNCRLIKYSLDGPSWLDDTSGSEE